MSPGIYPDLSGAEYFAATDWVSSSKLKHHLPEFYRSKADGDRSVFDFGTAVHTTVLGVGDPIWLVPFQTWQGKEAQAQRAAAYEAGETPILEKDMARIEAMAKEVMSHPEAGPLLSGEGRNELSVFAEVDGMPCKARFDRITGTTGIDLKTTSAMPSEHDLVRAILSFGYDVSADHYWRVAEAAGISLERFCLICVGKEPPHYVTVVDMDLSFYERAAVLREIALDRIMHAEMVPAYPGAEKALTVELPRWARLSR